MAGDIRLRISVDDKGTLAVNKVQSSISRLKSSVSQASQSIEKDWGRVKRAIEGPLGALNNVIRYGKIAIAGLATAGVLVGASFEQAMAKAGAAAGATRREMAEMGAVAREIGQTTTFSAKKAAEAMYSLGSAGLKIGEIKNVTPHIVNLAGALDAELDPAAELVIKTLRQFGLQTTEAARIVNVFAAANQVGLLNFERLNESLAYVGTTANAAGISLEDTVAILSVLTDKGLDASMAGTALQSMLTDLAKPNKELQAVLGDTTIGADGLATVLDKVFKALPEGAEAFDAAAKLFDVRAVRALLSLKDLGVGGFQALSKDITGTNSAAEQYDRMMDTLQGDFRKFKASVEENMIAAFQAIAPELRSAMQAITEGVRDLKPYLVGAVVATADWIKENKELILTIGEIALKVGVAVIVINTLGTVIGNTVIIVKGIVGLFGILKTTVVLLGTVFKTVGLIMLGPWGWLALAIGAAIVLIIQFRDQVGAALKKVGEIAGKVFGWIWDQMMWLFDGIAGLLAKIWPEFAGWWDEAKAKVHDFTTGAIDAVADAAGDIAGKVKGLVDQIKNGVSMGLDDLKRLGEAAGGGAPAKVAVTAEAPLDLASLVQPKKTAAVKMAPVDYKKIASEALDAEKAIAMQTAAIHAEYTDRWLKARESLIELQLAEQLGKEGLSASERAQIEIEASAAVMEAKQRHADAVAERWMQTHQMELMMTQVILDGYGMMAEMVIAEGASMEEAMTAGYENMKRSFIRNAIEMTKAWIMQTLIRNETSRATEAAANRRSKFEAAKIGAVKAYGAFASIPIIGPALGAAAAAAAFAFLMAFRHGGLVPGAGLGDRVPARLEPGEFVMRRRTVETIGVDTLSEINRTGRLAAPGPAVSFVLQFPVSDHPAEDDFKREIEEAVVPVLEDLYARRRLRLRKVG